MDASTLRLASIDALKAVLILLVVAIHTAQPDVLLDPTQLGNVLLIVLTIAVPGFFWVDGFLFAAKLASAPSLRTTLRTGWQRLLLPWLIFSVGYVALRMLARSPPAGGDSLRALAVLMPDALPRTIWFSLASQQLYFLPTLFLVRLIAVSLSRSLAKLAPWTILLIALTIGYSFHLWIGPWYTATVQPPGPDPIQHLPWGLGFFLLGVACRRGALGEFGAGIAVPTVLVGVAVVAHLQGSATAWHTFQLSYLLAVTWLLVRLKTFPRWLLFVGRRTMGIYLLHAPIALVLARCPLD
ncbi:MAG: acyltransferase [Proteobacteria bacterium]|nr:acyltransferase [Pseudomonadota bacterium]